MKPLLFALSVLSALAALPGAGRAQALVAINEADSLPDPDRYPFTIYSVLGLGPTYLSLHTGYQNMYELLEGQGAKPAPAEALYGLGFGGRYRRLFAEAYIAQSLGGVMDFLYDNESRRISTQTFVGELNLGFAVWQSRNSQLLLRGGIGGVSQWIMVTDPPAGIPFDPGQLTPATAAGRWPILQHESAAASFSVEWLSGRFKRWASIMTSCRLGYQFGLSEKPWEAEDGTVLSRVVSDRAGMAYLSLNLWIGRNFERKSQRQKP